MQSKNSLHSLSQSTLGVQRWVFHKHHGDPYTIDPSSTRHTNFRSFGDSQKIFFENTQSSARPGTAQTFFRPQSAKQEISIKKKSSRPQTAVKKPQKRLSVTQEEFDAKPTFKKINRQMVNPQEKVVKEIVHQDYINYTLVDERDKKDKIKIEVHSQDLRKKYQSNELNPVFKFTFDYDLIFQNDSTKNDKIVFQLDQSEIISIFKNFKAQLPKNAQYSQCNCKDEYQKVMDEQLAQIRKYEDEIEQLKNEKEIVNNELDKVRQDNQSYVDQANERIDKRMDNLEYQFTNEQFQLQIKQLERKNQALEDRLERWKEEQKAEKAEKPVYESENEEIEALNQYIEKMLLKMKEKDIEIQYLRQTYTEKAQPECQHTYDELEDLGEKLTKIMKEQDSIDQMIQQYNSKQEGRYSDESQRIQEISSQMKMYATNQLEQMTRKCRNKLEEIKKGPQSSEELVAIFELNIFVNEKIKETAFQLRKMMNNQKAIIEKRQFSKFEVNEDKQTITILPEQKCEGVSTQTEEHKVEVGTQTFKQIDEDMKEEYLQNEKEVQQFFVYFEFLKTICAKNGSLQAIKAIDYFTVFIEKIERMKQEVQMKELQLDSTRYRADKNERDVQELQQDIQNLQSLFKKQYTEIQEQLLQKDNQLGTVNQQYNELRKNFMNQIDSEKKLIEKNLANEITRLKQDIDDKSHKIAKMMVEFQRKNNDYEQLEKKLEEDVHQLNQSNEEKAKELELKNQEAQQLEETYLDRIVQIENQMLKEKFKYNKKLIALEEDIQTKKGGSKQNNQERLETILVESCQNCKSTVTIDQSGNKKTQEDQKNGQQVVEKFSEQMVECSGEIAKLQKKYSKLRFQIECYNKLQTHDELLAQSSIVIDRNYQFSQFKNEFSRTSQLVVNFKLQNMKSCLFTKCILLNQMGVVEEVIEQSYNESKCKSVIHSNFNKTKVQQNNYDHDIKINLSRVPKNIKALAFVCHTEKNLYEYRNGFLQIYENGKAKYHQDFKDFTKANTALLLFIYRNEEGNFQTAKCSKFKRLRTLSNSFLSNFLNEQFAAAECYGIFDKEQANWTPDTKTTYPLHKNILLPVPKIAYKQFYIGLGWNSSVDVDSSIIMMDNNNNEYDSVFFGNIKSKDQAVIHSGDAREGMEGKDQEYISISLQNVNIAVQSMFIFISVYSKGMTFDDVEDVYCHFSLDKTSTPFAKYDLRPPTSRRTPSSCILVEIFRIQNTLWAIRPNSYYLTGLENAKEAVPVLQRIIDHDYTDVIV